MKESDTKKQKFHPGQLVTTTNAQNTLDPHGVMVALERHLNGDWGDVSNGDWELNDEALKDGSRLLSSYKDKNGTKFWIITEWDRSVTTILLPEDY